MKHNGFAEQMRQRLGNAEADVPEGLWDAIEQKLDAKPAAAPQMTIAKTPRRVVIRRWAVAASVAIVAGAGLWCMRTMMTRCLAEQRRWAWWLMTTPRLTLRFRKGLTGRGLRKIIIFLWVPIL